MTTYHMETDAVRAMAAQIKQAAESMRSQAQALNGSAQSVDWIGPSRDEFVMEVEGILRQLEAQIQAGEVLAGRAENEVAEWEQSAATLGGAGSPFSGGGLHYPGGSPNFDETTGMYWYQLIPVPAIFFIGPILGLPAWLQEIGRRFFADPAPAPQPVVVSPVPGNAPPAAPSSEPSGETPLGKLIHDSPASPSAQPQAPAPVVPQAPARDGYGTFYEIAPQSQGTAYGSAACLPTSLSMLTKYYHNQNSDNKAVEPGDLIKMLDSGDGTPGSGVGLDRLNDDLAELGYKETRNFQSDMTGLKDELKSGPLVVNVRVSLTSFPERAMSEGNAYNHSVLVKGVSESNVLINDPWSGKEMEIPADQFDRMWSNGDHWAQVVRP